MGGPNLGLNSHLFPGLYLQRDLRVLLHLPVGTLQLSPTRAHQGGRGVRAHREQALALPDSHSPQPHWSPLFFKITGLPLLEGGMVGSRV